MSMTPQFDVQVGTVGVVTTNHMGHPPEFFAQRVVDRLMLVADTAPEPIKAQAYAFKNQMFAVVLDGIQRAIASDRAYQIQHLKG